MWPWADAYICAMRDVIGLDLPEFEKFAAWEACSKSGGYRVMHEKFCMVCDRPEILSVDEENRPHSETGPSHRWRDGWELHHWHGVRVPKHWIESPQDVSPTEILATEDVEKRAAGVAIVGMARMLDSLRHEIIDSDPDPMRGDLIRVWLEGLPRPAVYLKAECPRNGTIMEAVPAEIASVHEAQAWKVGLRPEEFKYPEIRT